MLLMVKRVESAPKGQVVGAEDVAAPATISNPLPLVAENWSLVVEFENLQRASCVEEGDGSLASSGASEATAGEEYPDRDSRKPTRTL